MIRRPRRIHRRRQRPVAIPVHLAKRRCFLCAGSGMMPGVLDHERAVLPCRCVRRAVFRICLTRYHHCALAGLQAKGFARAAEYRADFELVARRGLSPDGWRFFQQVFLAGFQWLGARNEARVRHFRAVYLMEEVIGLRIIVTPGVLPDQYFALNKNRPAAEEQSRAFCG